MDLYMWQMHFFNQFMRTLYLKDPHAWNAYLIEPAYPIGPNYVKSVFVKKEN